MDTFIPRGTKLGEGFSKAEKLQATEVTPQHQASKGRSRVGWINDLLALRKVIILCSFCRVKFNPRKHGYRRVFVPDASGKTDGYMVNGNCDSCTQWTPNVGGGTAFQCEEDYLKTHIDPTTARRQARAGAKALGAWNFINNQHRKGISP
ncbi:MAG: hypothetical protein ACRD5H_01530 [Nitrososphaerales archaeon]